MLFGQNPKYDALRVFGFACYFHIDSRRMQFNVCFLGILMNTKGLGAMTMHDISRIQEMLCLINIISRLLLIMFDP